MDNKSKSVGLHCNFCGKTEHEASHLICGPDVFICQECVELCVDILDEKKTKKLDPSSSYVRKKDLEKLKKEIEKWEKEIEKWIKEMREKQRNYIKEHREVQNENSEHQKEHSKQINGYLDGFNTLLERLLEVSK